MEPPPPYPPPPPFIPLKASKVEDQIGLLKPFYQTRFTSLAVMSAPILRYTLPGPTMGFHPHAPGPMYSVVPYPPIVPEVKPDAILPDDHPNPIQIKMGPLGQILKGGASGGGSKKKKGAGAGTDLAVGSKKKKGVTGVGTGNGRKKKLPDGLTLALPGPVLAAPVMAQVSPPVMGGGQ